MAVSCAHEQKRRDSIRDTLKPIPMSEKENGTYYTILEFEKGTTKLTQKNKIELEEFLSKTENEGSESKKIKILTWPDIKKAKDKDIKIANERATAIMNYLKQKRKEQEELLPFIMTNRVPMLNRFLESDDPRQKRIFEKTGVITEEGEDLAALKENQTGKALILRDYE